MADLGHVARVLRQLPGLPQSARDMLADGVLCTPSPEGPPHKLCAEVLEMTAGVLREGIAACEASSVERQAAAVAAEEEHGRLGVAAEVAEAAAQAADNEVSARAAALDEAKKASKARKKDHELFKENSAYQIEKQQALHKHSDEAKLMVETMKSLTECPAEEPLAKVEAYLAKHANDKALLAAVSKALAVAPAQRHRFDCAAIELASSTISNRASSLAGELAQTARGEAELDAEMLGLWAIAEVAQDSVRRAELELLEAQGAAETAAADALKAKAAVESAHKSMSDLASEKTMIDNQLAEISRALRETEAARDGPPDPATETVQCTANGSHEPEKVAAAACAGDVDMEAAPAADKPANDVEMAPAAVA